MSNTNRARVLFLASSVALVFGLGLWATSVEAQDCLGTFPATGQITPATGTMTQTGATVRDDGFVRAGGALSYQDNGDGTITDLNTGLMWEKKSLLDGSDHDVGLEFPWSSPTLATVWDWVDALNATAFAGYTDWRLPNVKELQSIIDYGRANQSNPAVDPAFKRRLHRAHL